MFRKEFATVITKTGMIPIKDMRPFLADTRQDVISELRLLELDFFDDVRFAKQVADNYKMFFVNLEKAIIKESSLSLIKKSDMVKYRILPIKKSGNAVSVAIYDPSVVEMKTDIQRVLQASVEFILTNLKSWSKIYESVRESATELLETIREIEEKPDEGVIKEEDIGDEVVTYVNKVLSEAFIRKASDIHVEPYEKKFRIRFRIDGNLVQTEALPKKFMLPMISRFKIMSKMDIANRRTPQDGRMKLSIGGRPIDYRVSSVPTLFGEKVVLRLLDSSSLQLDMTRLGLEVNQLKRLRGGIHQPFGMCLVTGPTGSGKTTTLYSSLRELNKVTTNISTVEDPVEFNFEGINQVNIKVQAGLTFAIALKAFLRQDPDIMMVGEIRDLEVAKISVEAALTGHMVLATLHTNDACSTITRLVQMGLPPFLVADSLNVVVAQRLCRKICPDCRKEDPVSVDELVDHGIAPASARKVKIYKGEGCASCNNTGQRGRVAIYEVLKVTGSMRELIFQGAPVNDLKRQAIKDGMKTLRMVALTKMAKGMITFNEAVTNSSSDKDIVAG